VYPKDNDMKDLPDLQRAISLKRYDIHYTSERWWISPKDYCPKAMLELVRREYAKGKKILWVVNAVDRCIAIAKELEKERAYCYHSRFKYIHRLKIHFNIIEEFTPEAANTGVIAVTTQVCEMSLDLDADILITELAPAPALIQRMGRCNRDAKGRKGAGKVHIYHPPNNSHNPYKPVFYDSGKELMNELSKLKGIRQDLTGVNQEDLSKALEQVQPVIEPNKICKFTTPMWESISMNDFRDIEEFTVSAVLESDRAIFRDRNKSKKTVADIILQAPAHFAKTKEEGIWARIVLDETESSLYQYCDNFGLRTKG
ncbi:MAG: CRISPR-associated helicase Cas3', partial [Pyrinomonadaceae bacterium]